ncbi:MAG: chemotaxis-specific protein-glutamate methyltransferase CheB [Rhodocyclales bacterium]|nr:chemotaxis-specific protein-glutamate methyltransferase CheB [Rhodocyclales bacterium]
MNAGERIRVLVVEDSPAQRELQVHLLNGDPQLEVVGTAADGREALVQAKRCRPDVVSMDFHMPHIDGAQATRILMETQPLPIVIVTGSSARGEVAETFRAIEAGALAIVEKPAAVGSEAARRFVEMIRLMAEVKVVRRWSELRRTAAGEVRPARPAAARDAVALVAIGASTGGPQALLALLEALPAAFPVPIAIVQHISPGFTAGFAEWLADTSKFPVRVAGQGERLDPGQAYLAPDELHMTVQATPQGCCRVELSAGAPENGHRPSVAPLFRSVAAALGARAIGVLLTGMGKDGAAALLSLRNTGAETIVQTPDSAVVPGMPEEAIRLGAAAHLLPPERIGSLLAALVKGRNGAGDT